MQGRRRTRSGMVGGTRKSGESDFLAQFGSVWKSGPRHLTCRHTGCPWDKSWFKYLDEREPISTLVAGISNSNSFAYIAVELKYDIWISGPSSLFHSPPDSYAKNRSGNAQTVQPLLRQLHHQVEPNNTVAANPAQPAATMVSCQHSRPSQVAGGGGE
jgi:hypothetical protein